MVTGQDICRLMRQHRITLRPLAARMGITLTRVHEVRRAGLTDPQYVRDWLQAITGTDPGPRHTI